MVSQLKQLRSNLKQLADPERAVHSQRYFKTGPGEYAEGDQFLGIRVPEIRKLASHYKHLPLEQVTSLLHSSLHEERLLALIMLVNQFKSADESLQKEIYHLYLDNTQHINNWDLIDSSAPTIIGGWLKQKPRKKLYQLARSSNQWERRIAVLATFNFIKDNDFTDSLALAELLLNDKEDLIHKATGWMLREIGKRDITTACHFLDLHAYTMPRTMLRYAIEKLSEKTRKEYLAAKTRSTAQ